MKMKRTLVVISACLALAACADFGAALGSAKVLTDDNFARVDYGMTRDDALRLLGRPDETMRFPLSNSEAWDYRYFDTWGYLASFGVTFDAQGRVSGKISRRLNDGGDHGGT
jgi:outer membrane protein assembly factor BamE (lipoprotein component of BamABCDE complex)